MLFILLVGDDSIWSIVMGNTWVPMAAYPGVEDVELDIADISAFLVPLER